MILFTSDFFCVKCPRGGRFNNFKYFANHKCYVNEFLNALLILQDARYLLGGVNYCGSFSKCKKNKGGIFKRQKTLPLKNFSLSLHPYCLVLPHLSLSPSLSYSDVSRVKMFVLKLWVFLKDIWNFIKWMSLIKDEKCWVLWKTMLKGAIILLRN